MPDQGQKDAWRVPEGEIAWGKFDSAKPKAGKGSSVTITQQSAPRLRKPSASAASAAVLTVNSRAIQFDQANRAANVYLRCLGPGPQPRGFQPFAQANPASRNLQLGSGRLQNTNKLGGVGGAPGLPAQGRQPGGNTSFAQSITGSQPATPLDLSEFPSLSGAPQTQYQNPGQAVWGNPAQRATQHTPVQRPPQQQRPISQQSNLQQPIPQPSQAQEQNQHSREQLYTGSQMTGSNDDYHRGGQGGLGQLGASSQPPSTSMDEFPPLRRNGNDDEQQDRRGSLMQSAAFGGFPGSNAFSMPPAQDPARHRFPSAQSGRPDSRTSTINSLLDNFMSQQQQIGAASRNAPPQQQQSTRQQRGSQASGGAAQTAENVPIDEMSPIDKWGLPGLFSKLRSSDPDTSALAIGQDLTQLGMDLNSPEPLYETWSGPFAPPDAHPYRPTFTLPDCYTVDNAPPPRHKLPGFADETLIWIFYFQPRDVMQEFAATELTNRNWRYHKELQMWLTKDLNSGLAPGLGSGAGGANEPVISGDRQSERGSYIIFNPRTWQRARTEFELKYEDLDNHIQLGGTSVPGGGMGIEGTRMP
ncbi:MAG: hypothetical protein Q9166_006226 [cf. Caloplaca sp. 2 TL-2023]